MTDANKIFLFDSALPESLGMQDFLKSMGPSEGGIRGQNIGNGYISYGFLKALLGRPVKLDHISNALEANLSDRLVEEINAKCSHLVWTMKDDIREDFSNLPVERITRFLERILGFFVYGHCVADLHVAYGSLKDLRTARSGCCRT